MKTPPPYIRFDNAHVFVAAAFYLEARHGFTLAGNITNNLDRAYLMQETQLVMRLNNKDAIYQSSLWENYEAAPIARSLSEFRDLIGDLPIQINGHTVVFNKGSIKVGCTTIQNETVRKVAERLTD